jgi:hypothetical protein
LELNVPKLPGDKVVLNADTEFVMPIRGIDGFRDESLPASAYDERVPSWDEETPAWWEV